jgi:hypothetical protein
MNIEAYTAGAVVRGAIGRESGPPDELDGSSALALEGTTTMALDGGPPQRRAHLDLEPDDVVVVIPDAADLPIHAMWHPVVLDAGPYRISGDLPTQPGFDPGRALTRPGATFLVLRGVRIELRGWPAAGIVERAHALVNRYVVEHVAADLELGFFFPGATFETLAGRPIG